MLHNVTQRSKEWLELRRGKITATGFQYVMSKKESVWLRYKDILENGETFQGNKYTEWGVKNEPRAKALFELETGIEGIDIGFLQHDGNILVGCSPDMLIHHNEGAEIKCPYNTKNHEQFLEKKAVPGKYKHQVQGCLWVTKREFWYFISFDPRHDKQLEFIKVERDEEYIKTLEERVNKFILWWKQGEKIADCIK